jgi:hypothetical protein
VVARFEFSQQQNGTFLGFHRDENECVRRVRTCGIVSGLALQRINHRTRQRDRQVSRGVLAGSENVGNTIMELDKAMIKLLGHNGRIKK